MAEPRFLGVADMEEIAGRIQQRQHLFNEHFQTSVCVVLSNLSERYVAVRCVGGEWSGTKGELAPRDGIPLCPSGHPLLEMSMAPRLALVQPPADAGGGAARG